MIYIASDHAGFETKQYVKQYMKALNMEVSDLGPKVFEKGDDYPVYAHTLASRITQDDKGILICDTGIGMSIAANRHAGIRAALCSSVFEALRAREHNNANVLVFGAQTCDTETMKAMIKVFFDTPFSDEERHVRRVEELEVITS